MSTNRWFDHIDSRIQSTITTYQHSLDGNSLTLILKIAYFVIYEVNE